MNIKSKIIKEESQRAKSFGYESQRITKSKAAITSALISLVEKNLYRKSFTKSILICFSSICHLDMMVVVKINRRTFCGYKEGDLRRRIKSELELVIKWDLDF